jgi:hypothetical protein
MQCYHSYDDAFLMSLYGYRSDYSAPAGIAGTKRQADAACEDTAGVGRLRGFLLSGKTFRRLVVRYERYVDNFLDRLYLGCCLVLLRHRCL